jgi:hypothetical protein
MVFYHYLMPLDILQRMGKSPLLHLSPLALDQMLRLRLEGVHAGYSVSSIAQAPRPPSVAYDDDPGLESMPFPTVSTEVVMDPDILLNIFRRQLARQVPFISLPSDLTTEALSKKRPFLYRAIIVVASYHDSVGQIELGGEFVRHLTEHLIFLGERNLDILQALLVYISWSVTYSALM